MQQPSDVSIQSVGLVIAEVVVRDPATLATAITEDFREQLRVLLTRIFIPLFQDIAFTPHDVEVRLFPPPDTQEIGPYDMQLNIFALDMP